MNKVILIGNLAADPESRTTQSGIAQCTLRLAVQRRFANQQTGQRESDFFNVVCWRQTAEFAAKYLSKGRKVERWKVPSRRAPTTRRTALSAASPRSSLTMSNSAIASRKAHRSPQKRPRRAMSSSLCRTMMNCRSKEG